MKRRNATSAIGLLITLLITALVFLYFIGNFINKNDQNRKQEEVYTNQELEQKIDELQNIRKETRQAEQNQIDYLKESF